MIELSSSTLSHFPSFKLQGGIVKLGEAAMGTQFSRNIVSDLDISEYMAITAIDDLLFGEILRTCLKMSSGSLWVCELLSEDGVIGAIVLDGATLDTLYVKSELCPSEFLRGCGDDIRRVATSGELDFTKVH